MLIAINTCLLPQISSKEYVSYLKEIFSGLIEKHPQHQFIFLGNENLFAHISTNCNQVLIKNIAKNKFSFWYFNNIKLPIIIKKYKPDIVVQASGFVSKKIAAPQVLLLQNTLVINSKNKIESVSIKGFQLAQAIICTSYFCKNNLIQSQNINATKINVVEPYTAPIFKPLNLTEKLQVKDGFADGREYFLFNVTASSSNNLLSILKAFSLFKKWQKSNMKLLIIGTIFYPKNDVLHQLETYKYRDDVVLLKDINEDKLVKITAAAYCKIYTPNIDDIVTPILQAMQCKTPIIVTEIECLIEFGGNAAIYVNAAMPNEIATKMQLIYKDESLRNELIENGIKQALNYSLEKSVNKFWNVIEKFTNAN